MIGTSYVGYYSNYTIIVNKLTAFVNTVFYSLTASLGNLIVKEGKEQRYNIFKIMQSVSMVLSTFFVTCVLLLQQDFIYVWLGNEYKLNNLVVVAIVLNFYFSISLLPIWVFREATGLYQQTKFVMLITAVVNVIVSILLGKFIGLAGVIFATSISRITTYFWYKPKLLFKQYFGESSKIYFIGVLKSIIVTIAVCAIVGFVSSYIIANNWLLLIVKAVVVLILTALIEFIIYRKSEGVLLLKERIGNLKIMKK